MSRAIGMLALAIVLLGVPGRAHAQTMASGGRMELAGIANWTAPIPIASRDPMEFNRDGVASAIYNTDSELGSAVGFGGRFGVALSDRFSVEASVTYSVPRLVVQVSNDIEGAAPAEVSERVNQIAVDGGLVTHFGRAGDVRTRPFLLAGAGFLREVHEGQTLGANGQSYFVGAGLSHVLHTGQGWPKRMGLRFDARLLVRAHGVTLENQWHATGVFGGSLFVGF